MAFLSATSTFRFPLTLRTFGQFLAAMVSALTLPNSNNALLVLYYYFQQVGILKKLVGGRPRVRASQSKDGLSWACDPKDSSMSYGSMRNSTGPGALGPEGRMHMLQATSWIDWSNAKPRPFQNWSPSHLSSIHSPADGADGSSVCMPKRSSMKASGSEGRKSKRVTSPGESSRSRDMSTPSAWQLDGCSSRQQSCCAWMRYAAGQHLAKDNVVGCGVARRHQNPCTAHNSRQGRVNRDCELLDVLFTNIASPTLRALEYCGRHDPELLYRVDAGRPYTVACLPTFGVIRLPNPRIPGGRAARFVAHGRTGTRRCRLCRWCGADRPVRTDAVNHSARMARRTAENAECGVAEAGFA
ncbi:hypothetical protein GGTG_12529 [Gaeumannomyces tritici R3-111a-1]|uniref:Uncharacterized protein n=1 Tax=Gaeumannomyces tritici (strain R3-111a-1) TaxID=644352 RepID=J3PGA4_GAET3|nr:hypothetical protein GGTG_12529 [Gaeumannomyces tritici R3-111a-1]EJT69645.1 hypothetical protein GGTG_12529 [Gaeumannomyces tritici R3-111a-1]